MEKEEIKKIIQTNLITYNSVRIDFKDGSFIVGFFVFCDDSQALELENKYRFVTNPNSFEYQSTKDKNLTKQIKLEDIESIKHY